MHGGKTICYNYGVFLWSNPKLSQIWKGIIYLRVNCQVEDIFCWEGKPSLILIITHYINFNKKEIFSKKVTINGWEFYYNLFSVLNTRREEITI
jgi:hypothetical protein